MRRSPSAVGEALTVLYLPAISALLPEAQLEELASEESDPALNADFREA
jgi:hypothetical protein